MDTKFQDYLKGRELEESIKQILVLQEMTLTESELLFGDVLNEGVFDKVLKKTGLHVERNKGLIQYLGRAGKNIGKLVIAAIRRDTATVKTIMQSVKKEDLLDFVLKLDQATLHLITGPIHFIEAVTGIHIWAHVKAKAEAAGHVLDAIKSALQRVRDGLVKVVTDTSRQKKLLKRVGQIEKGLTPT